MEGWPRSRRTVIRAIHVVQALWKGVTASGTLNRQNKRYRGHGDFYHYIRWYGFIPNDVITGP